MRGVNLEEDIEEILVGEDFEEDRGGDDYFDMIGDTIDSFNKGVEFFKEKIDTVASKIIEKDFNIVTVKVEENVPEDVTNFENEFRRLILEYDNIDDLRLIFDHRNPNLNIDRIIYRCLTNLLPPPGSKYTKEQQLNIIEKIIISEKSKHNKSNFNKCNSINFSINIKNFTNNIDELI